MKKANILPAPPRSSLKKARDKTVRKMNSATSFTNHTAPHASTRCEGNQPSLTAGCYNRN